MIRRAVLGRALVSVVLSVSFLVACTGHPEDGTSIGTSGGTVSGVDGTVTLTVPSHAVMKNAVVKIVTKSAVVPDGATGFVPLVGFSVDVTKGAVNRGQVSVRYTNAQLRKAYSDPGLLVMLVSDHHGGWTPLPTRINTAAHTATATFPHFSGGELGAVRKVTSWFVNHVATWTLGPKKDPDCTHKGAWLGPDKGWSVENTNWSGGRIIVNPLDACVELARAGSGAQHVDATNRYWYAFDLALPPNSTVSLTDASHADSPSDFLLDAIYARFFDATIIPGHSFAQFTVPSNPAGQVLAQSAIADPVSIVVNAIASILTVASLGEFKADEAAFDAAETELYEQMKGTENLAKVAEMTAVGSDWRNSLDVHLEAEYGSHSTIKRVLDGYLNAYSVTGCIANHLRQYLPGGEKFSSDINLTLVGHLVESTLSGCWQFILGAALGASIKNITGQYSPQSGLALARAMADPKTILGTMEVGTAAQAKALGANYFATKLIFTQLPGPPAALPAFRTSDGHIRCYSLTSPTTGTYDGFGGGTNEPLAPGVYCFVDLDSNLAADVTGPGCQEPSFMSVTNAAAFSPQGLCTGDEAIERKMPEPSTSLPVARNGEAIDIAGAVCQVSSSGRMVVCASKTSPSGAEIFENNALPSDTGAGTLWASGCTIKNSTVSCSSTSSTPIS